MGALKKEHLVKCRNKMMDCNCWAPCCAGFGLGVILAVFASFKLVLILAGAMLIVLALRVLII